jgi:hypothetical protein
MKQPKLDQIFIFCCRSCGERSSSTIGGILEGGTPQCDNEQCEAFDCDVELADCCDDCREVFGEEDIDGGRCTKCGHAITQKEAES